MGALGAEKVNPAVLKVWCPALQQYRLQTY